MPQRSLPAVVMRGGTSRGVFLHAQDLPADKETWDAIFLEIMGSPDRLQVDGLGGGYSSTSKVIVVRPSEVDSCDVDYLFAQVGVTDEKVDYGGNCGNLTSAVGPFAVDEGIVAADEPITTLVLRNMNTGARVRARVPVIDGTARVQGGCLVAGIARPGAAIVNEYLDPGGAMYGQVLPTGQRREEIEVPGVGAVAVSIVDVSSPVAFVAASSLGFTARENPEDINSDPQILSKMEAIRGACAVRLGAVTTPEAAVRITPAQPKVAVIASPGPEETALPARIFSMQKMHHAFTATGLLCLGAAACIRGTIPFGLRGEKKSDETVAISHARGVSAVNVNLTDRDDGMLRVSSVSIERTARRLMRGEVFVRA